MVRQLDCALEVLRLIVVKSDGNAVHEIDQGLAEVISYHNMKCIQPLLLLLNDITRQDEGMWSIVHTVESFDSNIYINEFLSALSDLCLKAPAWASILLMRCLNDENARAVVVRIVREVDKDTKASVAWLCYKINQRAPEFLSKTVSVLIAAGER